MLIYCGLMAVILGIGCIFKVNETKKKQILFIIFIFTLCALIASLRSFNVGIDTLQYYRNYYTIGSIEWGNYDSVRYEFGYFALCKLLNYLSSDPQILLFVSSTFCCYSVGRFIYKNSCDVIFSSFLFVSLNILGSYMNLMRQAIAIAILLFGFDLLKKPGIRPRVFYCLIVLAAMLFHTSAVVMLVVLVVENLRYTRLSFLLTIVASASFFVFSSQIWDLMLRLFPSYSGYTDSVFAASNYFAALINIAICLVILCFGLIFYHKKRNRIETDGYPTTMAEAVYGANRKLTPRYDFMAYMLSLGLIFLSMAAKMTLMGRFSIYFTIYYIIWLPNTAQSMVNKRDKVVLTWMILFFSLAYYLTIAIIRPEWHGVIPYQFFWEV